MFVLALFVVWYRSNEITLSIYLKQNPSWLAMNEERDTQTERLKTSGKARLKKEKEDIIVMPRISAEAFVKEMEGCIKEGTHDIDTLKLKKMWEPFEKPL